MWTHNMFTLNTTKGWQPFNSIPTYIMTNMILTEKL